MKDVIIIGHVRDTHEIQFTNNIRIIVYWNVGDGDEGIVNETFGLEIEAEANFIKEDYWDVINIFSFGYEDWSEHIWDSWGVYVSSHLERYEKSEEGYLAAVKWLQSFDCMYTRGEGHLRDLKKIKLLFKNR